MYTFLYSYAGSLWFYGVDMETIVRVTEEDDNYYTNIETICSVMLDYPIQPYRRHSFDESERKGYISTEDGMINGNYIEYYSVPRFTSLDLFTEDHYNILNKYLPVFEEIGIQYLGDKVLYLKADTFSVVLYFEGVVTSLNQNSKY